MPSDEWKKTPKFIMRWSCLEDISRNWEPGYFVEPGAGTGTLTREFLQRGYTGVVQDISEETLRTLKSNLASFGDKVKVLTALDDFTDGTFDYLFSFEVLEHIPDDASALGDWTRLLRPGGRILLSTPAHQRKFSSADKLVGHVRRYERSQLVSLLRQAGYEQIELYNYGFPIGNLTRLGQRAYDRIARKSDITASASPVVRSIDSGIRTDRSVNLATKVLNERTLKPALRLQRRYYGAEKGDGWVATAVKPG